MSISSTSFTKTPQADDDHWQFSEDALGTYAVLDVMANDLGGKAKTLYSLDNGDNVMDLLERDAPGAGDPASTKEGARIWITSEGKVAYDASPIMAKLQALAVGESLEDSFTYAIRLGNGTLSWATVTVRIDGLNDAPVIVNDEAALVGSVQEDVTLTTSGQLAATDADNGAQLSWSVQGATAGAYGSISVDATGKWTYALDNEAHQSLADGESHDETFTIRVADEHGAFVDQIVTVTVTGTNDIPVVQDIAGTVREDGAAITLVADFTDLDAGDSHTFTIDTTGTRGKVINHGDGTFSYDPNGQFESLAEGEEATDTFTYTVDDGKGGVVTKTATVTITGVGGDDEGPGSGPIVAVLPLTFDGADPEDHDGEGSGPATVAGTGTNGNDVLRGTNNADSIDGQRGNDRIYGYGGDDQLFGGDNVDEIYGGAGNDTIHGDENNDTLYGGSGNDTIYGGDSRDVIYGGSGNDTIDGGLGNDLLIGGYGADVLTGGAGNDTFKFLDVKDTNDTITDFRSGEDKLDFSEIDPGGGGSAFAYGGEKSDAIVEAHSVTWFKSGADLVVLADTDGDLSTAEFMLTLQGVSSLGQNDFVL